MTMSLALALALTPQAAASATDIADAKCVGAMSLLEDQAAEADKGGMQSAMMFFLGKIVGRSGNAAVAPALKAAVEAMKPGGTEGMAAIAESCAAQVEQATGTM